MRWFFFFFLHRNSVGIKRITRISVEFLYCPPVHVLIKYLHCINIPDGHRSVSVVFFSVFVLFRLIWNRLHFWFDENGNFQTNRLSLTGVDHFLLIGPFDSNNTLTLWVQADFVECAQDRNEPISKFSHFVDQRKKKRAGQSDFTKIMADERALCVHCILRVAGTQTLF